MKNLCLSLVLMSVMAFPALAQSQRDDYQQGKIISIQKLPPAAPYEGDATQAPLKASVTRYNVSTQVGDTVYVYQYKVESGEVVPWEPGQTQEVRVKGNVIHVKRATGEDGHYTILSRAKANTQSPQ